MESSALALLDGSVHWDMHRPLPESCTLEVGILYLQIIPLTYSIDILY